MTILFTNNASTSLASGITSGATSLTVATGQGALFPTITGSNIFYLTLQNQAGTTPIEIVKVTARSGDTMTIVRGQDNTTASAFNAGDKVELRLPAVVLQDFPQLDVSNTFTVDQSISGLTVGKGTGAIATNTVVGASALATNTTGLQNTAIGQYSLNANTTGQGSVAVGGSALGANTTGVNNTAVGLNTLYNNQTGSYNSAFGTASLQNNTGSNNTAFGKDSLFSNTTASNNTAVGYQSLYSNTASNNTAVGFQSMYANTTGGHNCALGLSSLTQNTTGNYNNAFGWNALTACTTGSSNTAMGEQALFSNTTASNNTAVGYQALLNSTGGYNTALGTGAGSGVTTGAAAIHIGYNAGSSATTGNYNVYIGNSATASSAGVSSETVLGGNAATGKGANTAFIAGSSGSYQGNNSAAWSVASDQRLKKNIVDNTVGLSAINQIQVRNFEYRLPEEVTELEPQNAIDIKGVQLGAIAQELKEILPECVKTESTGVMSVDTTNLTWYLVNAIKELNATVTAQAATIAALQAKVGV